MKNKLILTLVAVGLSLPLQARTWTSADGKNKFEGEFVSSTDTTVTVLKKGNKVTFKLELLSDEDKTWIVEEVKTRKEQAENPTTTLKDQKIGKKLIGNTMTVLEGKFVAQDTQKVPDYYVVYYSASW